MDILGPLPTTTPDGYKYVLVFVDSFSKWCELIPLKTQEAVDIAWVLYTDIFSRYGAPKQLISDRGQNFLSKIVQSFCTLFDVKRYHTSPYHPQTNSACERLNSTIAQTLRTYIDDKQNTWPKLLPAVAMAYRLTPATRSSQFSPYFLLFGQEMRTPLDATLPLPVEMPRTTTRHLQVAAENLKMFRQIAKENVELTQTKEKKRHDSKVKAKNFAVGDRVLMQQCRRFPGLSPKLSHKWTGPYYVTEVTGRNTVKLRWCSSNKDVHVRSRINITRLRKYYDPDDRLVPPPSLPGTMPVRRDNSQPHLISNQSTNTPHNATHSQPSATGTTTDKADVEWYAAEKIIRSRGRGSDKEYLVRWEGDFPDSWQHNSDVSPALIRYFGLRKYKNANTHRV